jgi:polyhydroxybutyrate depolymerase
MIALVFLCLGGLLRAAEPVQTWRVDGIERQGMVFAPESAKTEPAPLLFAFHGHGSTMQQAAKMFNFQTLWPQAIVVYLQGVPTTGLLTDPDGKRAGWQHNAGDLGDRDLKFFDTVLEWAKKTYKVDDKQVYCTGHSNGGGFTYLLWAERSDVFAAVAPASSAALTMFKKFKPKPMIAVGGTEDPLVKFNWQRATVRAIREINGCEAEGKMEGDCITIYPSATGTPVETYFYEGGHMVPPEAWPEVVKFFKEHPGK